MSRIRSSPYLLEFITEVQIKVGTLGAVAVAGSGSDRTEYCTVIESGLDTEQGATVEEVLHLVALLATGHAEQYVAATADALLCLQLCGHELVIDVLYVANAGKGHLLLNVMTEPLCSDGITEGWGDDRAEEQTSVEHRLESETIADGERHAPVGVDVAHTGLAVELGEVIGEIRILCLETRTTGGEVPVVLAIVVHTCMVAVEVLVLQHALYGGLCTKYIAVVHVVPTQTVLDVEVTQVVVDRDDLGLELVVADVVVAIAFAIDVNVVTPKGIGDHRADEAAGMDGQLALSHQTLAKAQGDIGADRNGGLQGDVETKLHGGIFLGVVAEASVELHRLAISGTENDLHTVGRFPFLNNVGTDGAGSRQGLFFHGDDAALGRLVKEVDTHRRGDLLL